MKHYKYHRKIIAIEDIEFINMAINYFNCGRFKKMKSVILDYGEESFFSDLNVYLESKIWRKSENRYLTFVGIAIQYFKIYT